MDQKPPAHIVKDPRWQSRLLLGLLPSVLVLSAALVWGTWRILDQEHSKLELDWREMLAYIEEQEAFLRQLQQLSTKLDEAPSPISLGKRQDPVFATGPGARLRAGLESVATLPQGVACAQQPFCPEGNEVVWSLGAYVSDFYATYWVSSFLPAPAVFLISRGKDGIANVSSIGAFSGYETITPDFSRTTEAVKDIALTLPVFASTQGRSLSEVHWFRVAGVPQKMVGVAAMQFSPHLWPENSAISSEIFVSSLLSRDRLYAKLRWGEQLLPYEFWLSHRNGGVLIGSGVVPKISGTGFSLTREGLVWKGNDKHGIWTGISFVSYRNFFSAHWSLFFGTLLVLVLLLIGGLWNSHWYRRRVLTPALDAQRRMLDIDSFNQTLFETAPVGLCVLSQETGDVVSSNAIADEWLGLQHGAPIPAELAKELRLLSQVEQSTVAVTAFRIGGRDLSVAYAWSIYRDQRVMVCAFSDLTARVQMEQELTQAKRAADEANQAKSLFLATMSHEIRTPLYGLQGTMELLSATQLTPQQRLYACRIEEASHLLLQLISDILDIGRIETGQLALELTTFSPVELVQNCVRAYVGMAQQKGLLIFSCVDPEVPALVAGDPVRVRQILNNLISNAIKFTAAGRVVVQLRGLDVSSGYAQLNFEVCDTGVGIEKHQQEKIFQPFFAVQDSTSALPGTGLGLSICERLARLMGSSIQVRSERQIGSCFAFDLRLKVEALQTNPTPDLTDSYVVVRTPNDMLTKSISAWLSLWGAEIATSDYRARDLRVANVWIDILMPGRDAPKDWSGEYLCLDPMTGESTHPEIDSQSIWSIGRGLEQFLNKALPAAETCAEEQALALKVLVAEDNPINQTTMRDQLEQLGCQVTLADDGEDALAFWDMESYDIVLTDVNMPRLNGYDLTRTLRSEGVTCPIVGITANASPDEVQRCQEAGMDVCLVKPIRLQALALTLRNFKETSASRHVVSPEEVHVPAKYRDLFLQTMQQDSKALIKALELANTESVVFSLHRMSGALAEVNHLSLMKRFQALEMQVKKIGLTKSIRMDVDTLIENLRHFLTKI